MHKKVIRKCRISEMEHWCKKYIDLVTPGYITFDKNSYGEIQFGTLRSLLHYSIEKTIKLKESIFWQGESDTDIYWGKGWAIIKTAMRAYCIIFLPPLFNKKYLET